MDHDKPKDNSVDSSPVHTGGVKSRKKRLRTVLLVVGVAVVAGGAGAAWYWWQQKNTAPKLDPVARATTDAQEQALSGDFDEAHETIGQSLNDPNLSKEAKQSLYMQEGSTYENQEEYEKAMESYRKAEELGLSAGIAQSIAFLAIKLDDKETAIAYFKKTIPLLPEGQMKEENVRYFENWIIHLEGGKPKYE